MTDEPGDADEAPAKPDFPTQERRGRRAVRVEDLSEEEIAAIAAAEVDPRHAHLGSGHESALSVRLARTDGKLRRQ